MKKMIVVAMLLLLTACTQFIADLTGMEFLHDRRTRKEISVDASIEKSAYSKIKSLTELKKKARIKVRAYRGKVLIAGETETAPIRDKIIANIRIIKNIRVIYNELQLKAVASEGSINKDTQIRGKVRVAIKGIKAYSDFDETRVKVIVSAANVYLMGLLYKEEANIVSVKVQKIENINSIVTFFEYIEQENVEKEKSKKPN